MESNQNTYNNTKKVRDMESSFISVFCLPRWSTILQTGIFLQLLLQKKIKCCMLEI